ncbi:MAG: SOS response-associated peptidase [Halanaeroarchaeum sp.]
MCGRTSLFTPQPAIERSFEARFETDYEPRYNVAPRDDLVVVHDADPGVLTTDEWGFVPEWADDPTAGPRPINARAESIDETPLFSAAFASRRALVVADGFYEWRGERGSKRPYRVAREDGEPFAMAGLWSRLKGDGPSRTLAIATTAANDLIAPIHDRMPVVVPPDRETAWLDADASRAKDLLEPREYPAFETVPISTAVNDPENDSPAVVEPVEGHGGQTGLGDFAGE